MAECADAQDPSVKENRFTRVLDFHGDMGEYQELFQILEDAYQDLDSVLEETGLATMNIPTEDVHIREELEANISSSLPTKCCRLDLKTQPRLLGTISKESRSTAGTASCMRRRPW